MSRALAVAARSAAVAVFFLSPLVASGQTPVGLEFRANASTTGFQYYPSIAVQPSGGLLVTWTALDGSGPGVFGRRFDAAGLPVGGDFVVNHFTAGYQQRPQVRSNAAGGFVVVWESTGQDGSAFAVMARRFDAAATPLGVEFLVNTTTTGFQDRPTLAVRPSGEFVVAWEGPQGVGSYGIFAQRFDAAGARVGGELPVSTSSTVDEKFPSVAMDDTGDFVVAWSTFPGVSRIAAQRFDGAGAPVGAEFQVNTSGGSVFEYPAVAMDAAGQFIVAWQVTRSGGPGTPDFYNVHAQWFDAAGVRVGAEYLVPSSDAAQQPGVAALAGGGAVLAWQSFSPQYGEFGRRFDAAGAPSGPEFRIDTGINPRVHRVALDSRANALAVAWEAKVSADPNSDQDIFVRRFSLVVPAAMTVDGAAGAGSDGNGVLEAGESVSVDPAWGSLGIASAPFGGSATGFSGPGDSTYALLDAAADYGPIPAGGTASCRDASPDCYGVAVSVPTARPAVHWDAALDEAITTGGSVRWSVHVGESFGDVPRTSPFYRFVETLLHRQVTAGCAGASYCPVATTSRQEMAVFVLAAREVPGYAPQPCFPPNLFLDVPETSPFCRWIEELARRGVVAGCGGGLYCPAASVSREQMAVFVLRTLDPTLSPPACAPPNLFNDVPETSPFCRWIEELAARGVVGGCGGGAYCPAAPVTREQMAVFIALTFGLTLYGP